MDKALLEILRCPHCGGGLTPGRGARSRLADGTLSCACCAYPVVAGIPYLCLDEPAEKAMHWLGKGENEKALFALLDLDRARRRRLRRLLGGAPTWRELVEVLSLGGEGRYFLYRFSDPTFLAGQAAVRAVARDRRCRARYVLDLCGGPGHLTRALCRLPGPAGVVLADNTFGLAWLARRFLAPACHPVCCDANQPLPFAAGAFSLVVCADAFHYVWSKRLLAGEMARLVGDRGAVVLPHLHNALGANYSAGLPLTPARYRALFEGLRVRLYPESAVLDRVLNRGPIDLSADHADGELAREDALLLVATRLEGLFRAYGPDDRRPAGRLAVNPLYRVEQNGTGAVLKLRFPSREYAEEFAVCKRYLPERVELPGGLLERLRAGRAGAPDGRAGRFVLLDLPEGYL